MVIKVCFEKVPRDKAPKMEKEKSMPQMSTGQKKKKDKA